MTPCARALLEGIIDYAGLFPPAQLPMDQAFARFVEHRVSNDGWMLARFVCPAARLGELEPLLDAARVVPAPFRIAVLGRGGDTLEAFNTAIDRDAEALGDFVSRRGAGVAVDVFEVRLPAAGGAAVAVERAWRRLTDNGSQVLTPYFEVPLVGDWRPRLPAAAAAVRDTDRAAGRRHRVGLKIRCGDLDAAAVPEPMAVAAAIATCRATAVPLKATQGLHHPFRHHDPELGAPVHGFLNLFTAAILAQVHDLPVTLLTEIVAETDPAAFALTENRIGWRDLSADADEVEVARERLLSSFGSCSFAEPRDDLRSLELIDP